MKKILICILIFGMPGVSSADNFSQKFDTCMTDSGGETARMLDCLGAEIKRQDTLLNAAYKSVIKPLTKPRQGQLQGAQRAWLKFRDANCSFYADPEGGTAASVASADCFLSATARRAQELEDLTK